jgi:ER protein Pkr1
MSNFLVELWESVFTPGPTPTLLIATNASFGALQLLLLILLIATSSIHFIVLSILCAGLWYSINWFAREIRIAKEEEEAKKAAGASKKSDDVPGAEDVSDTETEVQDEQSKMPPPPPPPRGSSLKPLPAETLRKRQSLGDSSGYVSTDSEWEKVSDAEDKSH